MKPHQEKSPMAHGQMGRPHEENTSCPVEKRNGVFIKPLPGQKEVEDILAMTDDWEGYYRIEWKYLTVSEFIDHWSNYLKKYSTQQIGIVLKFLGISTDRVSIDGQQRRLKKLPVRTFTKQNND